MMDKQSPPKFFVIDVDGVMTNGQFWYSKEGKTFKVFGPDDHDGLSLLKDKLEIIFISGDRKGWPITQKRIVDDMNFRLELVSTVDRIAWFKKLGDPKTMIYMGDGIFDTYVFKEVGYSICPANSFYLVKERANFVTEHAGGDRAVAEACLHIMEKFFEPYDPDKELHGSFSGEWQKV